MADDTRQGSRGQMRILIVPDDLLTWEVRESFLDRSSFVVRTALNAGDALAISEAWHPTLVFFRSKLRGMSVSRFCIDLRKVSSPETKLLMFTDQVGDSLDDAIDAQSDAHLISPIEPEQILETIASLMTLSQRRSPRVPLEALVQTDDFVELSDAADTGLSNSINVSKDGMLLESSCQLPIGAEGKLSFFLPSSSQRIVVKAVVRIAVDEIRLHYALEFLGLSAPDDAIIRQYVTESGRGR